MMSTTRTHDYLVVAQVEVLGILMGQRDHTLRGLLKPDGLQAGLVLSLGAARVLDGAEHRIVPVQADAVHLGEVLSECIPGLWQVLLLRLFTQQLILSR